ncbi:hypothetical protein KM043_011571 [Ampulex compressa]|nr:hypothetical protein KM043_011571 [Ampulex compressa]
MRICVQFVTAVNNHEWREDYGYSSFVQSVVRCYLPSPSGNFASINRKAVVCLLGQIRLRLAAARSADAERRDNDEYSALPRFMHPCPPAENEILAGTKPAQLSF